MKSSLEKEIEERHKKTISDLRNKISDLQKEKHKENLNRSECAKVMETLRIQLAKQEEDNK